MGTDRALGRTLLAPRDTPDERSDLSDAVATLKSIVLWPGADVRWVCAPAAWISFAQACQCATRRVGHEAVLAHQGKAFGRAYTACNAPPRLLQRGIRRVTFSTIRRILASRRQWVRVDRNSRSATNYAKELRHLSLKITDERGVGDGEVGPAFYIETRCFEEAPCASAARHHGCW